MTPTSLADAPTAAPTQKPLLTGTRSPRVLLTTPLGPYEPYYYDTSLTDVWNQRFSRGCGIFTLSGHIHTHFAHALAQNIGAPSVFLEYPTQENFIAELKRGYDIVGISGFQHQVETIIRMGQLVREHAPDAQVIVGAWAAMGIQAVYPEHEWRRWFDHLCVSEGIRFMRELLGEDPCAPVSITHLPKGSYTFGWLDQHLPGNIGAVVASLGCTRGCDFCGPTTLLDRRRQELLTPRQVVSEMERYWEEDPDLLACAVYEEDSFADKRYLMEIGRLIREETAGGLSRLNLFILGGVRSLDQFEFDDVARCGVTSVFIGVESKFAPDQGYDKAKGRPMQEVFRELHRRGIATIGGWMAGFDFQTRENIQEDLAHFIALEPTMQQLTRVCPFPGTPMWRRLVDEGRLDRRQVPWEKISFFGGGGLPPQNFEDHELETLVDRGYRQLYETWGSCFARLFNVHMNGYEYCSAHSDPHLRHDRSRLHKRMAARAYPFFKAHEVYAPNGTVRRRMRSLRQRYQRLLGAPTLSQRVLERVYLRLAGAAYQREQRGERLPAKVEPFKRYDYTIPRLPGARPYQATHPNRDLSYDLHRTVRQVVGGAMSLTDRALNGIESAVLRELDPELLECLPGWR